MFNFVGKCIVSILLTVTMLSITKRSTENCMLLKYVDIVCATVSRLCICHLGLFSPLKLYSSHGSICPDYICFCPVTCLFTVSIST